MREDDWELDYTLSRVSDVPRWTYYPADIGVDEARARVARSLANRVEGRGLGLATLAVEALCAWAFAHGADRVQALTMLENTRSERVLERASFVRGDIEVEPDGLTVTRWSRTRDPQPTHK